MASTLGGNLGLNHSWDLGESGWNLENDGNLIKLDAFVLAEVLSATTVAEPGSPSDGDRYIVPASATGTDWAGEDGNVAVFTASWTFYPPKEGWEFRAEDTAQRWTYNSSAWALEGSLYGQFADDTSAASGSVPIGGVYVNSSTGSLQVRLT